MNKPSAASGLKSLCGSGCTVGWRIWTPPKMTCTDWPPTWPRGYLVSHRGRPLIEAAETRGRDGKVVPIGIAQEKTPVWRGAARPKAKSTRRIRTWNWGQQMAFVNHFYFYLCGLPTGVGRFWKTSASRRFCDPASTFSGETVMTHVSWVLSKLGLTATIPSRWWTAYENRTGGARFAGAELKSQLSAALALARRASP